VLLLNAPQERQLLPLRLLLKALNKPPLLLRLPLKLAVMLLDTTRLRLRVSLNREVADASAKPLVVVAATPGDTK
jgi:hypothetical protein